MHSWTFGRKVGAGFAIAILALVVVAVAGYRTTTSLIANDHEVAHTHAVRQQLQLLLVDLVNAETGQRGFVITGKDTFLAPYTQALAAIDHDITALRRLTADNPDQLRRLEALTSKIELKQAEMKTVIDLRGTGVEPAIARVNEGEGMHRMDAVRALVREMDDAESELLKQRTESSEAATSTATSVIAYSSVAAIVLVLVGAWILISSLTRQLGRSARDLQSSSAELQAAANQQASGSAEQATAMAEIATTISELLATSRQIAESSQRVAQIASETGGAARSGNAVIKRSNEATSAVRRQVDQIVSHMLDLGKKAQQVGAVLDIVSELAEQTNILAINATIEAAGAGEAGRRFGVVAAEIRSLADRVGGSTKEIRTLIEDVRGAVNTTVMATEAGSKAVDTSAASIAEMSTSFTQIASLVGTTSDAAREIELSTKQQASAVEQVNVAITNVAQTTRETEASASQTLQTSAQLTKLSSELLQIVRAG
ncbi:MAG: CHASE3 domain-containing protein [Kofleriaceae bacterium]